MRVTAIIAAGGRGTRVGSDVPKQLRMAGGRTLLEHALMPFDRSPRVDNVVVVLPTEYADNKIKPLCSFETPIRVLAGGDRRQDSVATAVDTVGNDVDIVLIHDAARPFCSMGLISSVVDAAAESGAAVPAVRISDTVKEGRADDGQIMVEATLPRDCIYLAQTPQGFATDVIKDAVALGRRGVCVTDEAMLVERAGLPVRLIDGDADNFKVTTYEDFERARNRITRMTGGVGQLMRVGIGYDSHRTAIGRRLILGGVDIPHSCGLEGHSDADVVCHAVADAILGGAAAGDIGEHFPNTDPRWKDASSVELLRAAVSIVAGRGLQIGNLDVVIIAEQPRVGPYVSAMVTKLSEALGVDANSISVKGKTAEGLDAIGRGEAIATQAVATLVPSVL